MKHYGLMAAAAVLAACSPGSGDQGAWRAETGPRLAVIETSAGDIRVALAGEATPVSVANFIRNAKAGAYDGGYFYRAVRPDNDRPEVEPMSLIQGGHGFDGLPG
ncbi:MAG: peptidylprolyl isomerase, partial [Oceanicaulis sp.]